MDSEYDVIFSVFDPHKGPIVYFTSLKSVEIAKKAAVKSFIAIGGTEQNVDLSTKQAVLSLADVQKIAFFYMFKINMEHSAPNSKPDCWAVLGYTHDSAKSIHFYRSIPLIEKQISKTAKIIRDKFTYSDQITKLDNTLTDLISALRSPDLLQEPEAKPVLDLNFEDIEGGDLSFLIEYFSKDLAKIVYALMLEEPVVITGDVKTLISKLVSSITIMLPHRPLVNEYITEYTDPKGKDIIICSGNAKFLKKFKGIAIADVVSRKVKYRIKSFPSIEELLNTLRVSPKDTHKPIIHTYVDKLLSKVAELMELCEPDQIDRSQIRNFRSDLKGDELNLVIQMVKNYAPQFQDKLMYFARSMM